MQLLCKDNVSGLNATPFYSYAFYYLVLVYVGSRNVEHFILLTQLHVGPQQGKRDRLWVGFPFEACIKYLKCSFLRSGVEAKDGVEFRY